VIANRKLPSPNLNALSGLFLWGILSPTQLSRFTGTSLSLCLRQLQNLVQHGLASDLGRTRLAPSDPLYGHYFSLKRTPRLGKYFDASPCLFPRARGKIGRDKLVYFNSEFSVPRHYIFSVNCTAWVVSLLGELFPEKQLSFFPEPYLRQRLGWHHLMGPARSALNPKFTMVPDSLLVFDGQEIKIEAEITPKSARVYNDLFQAARPHDDNILYIFPDAKMMEKVLPLLPSGYRVHGCWVGDRRGLLQCLSRLFPSLFAR
jgi:hypothetical protein